MRPLIYILFAALSVVATARAGESVLERFDREIRVLAKKAAPRIRVT